MGVGTICCGLGGGCVAVGVVQVLLGIEALLPELEELERGACGPRSVQGQGRGCSVDRLPFGICVDDPDEPADATTAAGVRQWARVWVKLLNGKSVPDVVGPVAFLAYLYGLTPSAMWWDDIKAEAEGIYRRIARRTGHADVRVGRCMCGGVVYRRATERGLSDWMVCDGPGEHWFKDEDAYATAQRAKARAIVESGRYWVSAEQVRVIWPQMDRRLLQKWASRGLVARRGALYDLGQINARMSSSSDDVSVS